MSSEGLLFKPSKADMAERTELDRLALFTSIDGYRTGKLLLKPFVAALEAIKKAYVAGMPPERIEQLAVEGRAAITAIAAHVRETAPTLARKLPDDRDLQKYVMAELYAAWLISERRADDGLLRELVPERGVWEPLEKIRAELGVDPPKHRPAGSGRRPDPEARKKIDAACDAIEGRKGGRRRKLTREAVAAELDMPVSTFRDWLKANGLESWRTYLRRRKARLT